MSLLEQQTHFSNKLEEILSVFPWVKIVIFLSLLLVNARKQKTSLLYHTLWTI